MKIKHLIIAAIAVAAMTGCCSQPKDYGWIKTGLDRAAAQLLWTAEEIADTNKIPRSIWAGYDAELLERQLEKDFETFKDSLRKKAAPELLGKRRLAGVYDWTSGFFPGSLWYAYELTGGEALKEAAVKFTNLLYPVSHYTQTHDLGFMINCSYGNAHRLAPCDTIPEVLVRTADNLCSRFNKEIGCIRSWDFGAWNFPVIIDNMMNLDLLFSASKITGNPYYAQVAVIHANTTMANHFREDMTSYHVVSYNPDGTVEVKQTYQGKADDSAWARGQAWGVYGYTAAKMNGGQKDILLCRKDVLVHYNTRSYQLHNATFYKALDTLGVLQLLTHSNPTTCAHQLGEVCADGVVGKTCHVDESTRAVGLASEGNAKDGGRNGGVLAVGFIEVANPEKQDRIGVCSLDTVVLLHQGCFFLLFELFGHLKCVVLWVCF